MRKYLKHYLWFWKESFDYMKGYNKFYIIWGCLRNAHKFTIHMCKWDKMNTSERLDWYINSDRRI